MKKSLLSLGFTVVMLLGAPFAKACTTFCLKDSKHLVFGKNFDFYTGIGQVQINKRDVAKLSIDLPPEKPVRWTSRYGSVTFNQVGREFPYGGINEKGLVIEIMWLADTKYPEMDNRQGVIELQWIQYQLDNAATVKDVLASDAVIRISKLSTAPVHFLLCDAGGNTATVEYIDGKMVSHTQSTLPVCALTNDTYDLSYQNLRSIKNPDTKKFTASSYDRFANAASMVQSFKGHEPINYAFDILEKTKQKDFTQWSIVYDIRNMTIHYKTSTNTKVRKLKVSDMDFSCGSPVVVADIDVNMKNDKPNFVSYTYQTNKEMINLVFSKVDFLKDIPEKERELIARYPDTMQCAK